MNAFMTSYGFRKPNHCYFWDIKSAALIDNYEGAWWEKAKNSIQPVKTI